MFLLLYFFTASWVVLLCLMINSLLVFHCYKFPAKRRKKYNKLLFFLSTLLALVLTKIYCLDIYYIPTDSMTQTILPGDFVLVNKLSVGIRNCSDSIDLCNFKKKWGKISSGDIVIFNMPTAFRKGRKLIPDDFLNNKNYVSIPNRMPYVKRIIGLPGDSLSFNGATTSRNKTVCLPFPKSQLFFLLSLENGVELADLKPFEDLFWRKEIKDTLNGEIQLKVASRFENLTKIERLSLIKSVRTLSLRDSMIKNDSLLVPAWNLDFIPSFYIPKAGDTVVMDSTGMYLYRLPLLFHENDLHSSRYTDLQLNRKYTFRKNYYFVKGDQHFSSIDSRYWGLVPEDHFIGRVERVLFSLHPYRRGWRKWRWERIWMKIE